MTLKNLLKPLAPILASLLGSPLSKITAQAIGQVLLKQPQAKLPTLNKALKNIDAEQLVALKRLEADLQTQLFSLSLAKQSRSPLHQYEIILRDNMPAILAIFMTLGFFALLGTLIMVPLQQGAQSAMNFMVGSFCATWFSSIAYCFSVDYSRHKNGNGHKIH